MAARASARRRVYSLMPGDRIGRHEIVAPLALGGMAELYVARPHADPDDTLVVVKRTLPQLAQDPEFSAMFLKEARLASGLTHPNIAKVLGADEDDGEFFIVLEYVHGYDLRALIRAAAAAESQLPLDVALGIAQEVCAGLHYAHEHCDAQGRPLQLVHRDVTPSNVLLDLEGRVLLTDFGIARALTTMRTTRAGVIKGKLGYMSPEQCRDEHLDRRSDIFSMGVLLYEMTTGFRMFHAGNDFAVLNKIAKGEFVRPAEAVSDYPRPLEEIVLRCVSVDPDDRYETAAALSDALRTFASQADVAVTAKARAHAIKALLGPKAQPEPPERAAALASDTATPIASATSERRRGRTIALAAALGIGALGGGAAVMVSRASPDTPSTAPSSVRSAEDSSSKSSTPSEPAPPAAADPADAATHDVPPPAEPSASAPPPTTEVAAPPPEPTRAKRRRRKGGATKRRDDGDPNRAAARRILPPSMQKNKARGEAPPPRDGRAQDAKKVAEQPT